MSIFWGHTVQKSFELSHERNIVVGYYLDIKEYFYKVLGMFGQQAHSINTGAHLLKSKNTLVDVEKRPEISPDTYRNIQYIVPDGCKSCEIDSE